MWFSAVASTVVVDSPNKTMSEEQVGGASCSIEILHNVFSLLMLFMLLVVSQV